MELMRSYRTRSSGETFFTRLNLLALLKCDEVEMVVAGALVLRYSADEAYGNYVIASLMSKNKVSREVDIEALPMLKKEKARS